MFDFRNVVSYDEQKIKLVELDGRMCIKKKTIRQEYINYCNAKKACEQINLLKENKFKLKIPEIIAFNENKNELILEYCNGENIEIRIREKREKQKENIEILEFILKIIKRNGFLWSCAAPRNILLDYNSRDIFLVDFEKSFIFKNRELSNCEYNYFIGGYIYEEYSSMLLIEEQKMILPKIENTIVPDGIFLKDLTSKRRMALIKMLFPNEKEKISFDQVLIIEKYMCSAQTPFYVGSSIQFPLIDLDKIKDPIEYAKKVVKYNER